MRKEYIDILKRTHREDRIRVVDAILSQLISKEILNYDERKLVEEKITETEKITFLFREILVTKKDGELLAIAGKFKKFIIAVCLLNYPL